ncbi:putative lysin motif containing protein [Lyophyllum shimeji]|uniref:Lysin motif containing protein n=1 Tax=Lyophyllum shimeji TaxID=47721 RepID=A0A9P3UQE3_LYOSH|nr:putative lysin motif containing protein [Lyophyllum shimeji]
MFFRAAFLALPFLAQSVLAKDCARKYTIKEGDICDSISAANNVSTYQLSAINTGIIDTQCSNLVPGKELCIGYLGEDCSSTYKVVADDTCERIAAAHNLNATILHLNNPQIDQGCNNIYIGEVLCVSDKVQVPPAPAGGFLPGATIPVTSYPAKPTPKAPVAPSVPAPAPTKAPSAHSDEEDLPYCDEL